MNLFHRREHGCEHTERLERLERKGELITRELATLNDKLFPAPPEPRRVSEPEHVYALAKGSVIEDPTSGTMWLVTEVVNPPESGSHDPICLRLDANTNQVKPASELLTPGEMRVLREGIGPNPQPAPVHRKITYPPGFRRPV